MMDGKSCMQCRLEKPLFLHNVYDQKNFSQLCTTCLLKLHPGSFCPICFEVYESKNPNPSSNLVNCYSCPAISHLSCISGPTMASASTSTTSSISISIEGVPYMCPSCFDPKLKFFNLDTNKETEMLLIDQHLAYQLLAAALISQRMMKEAAILHRDWAEMKAEEALKARKKAKLAIELLAQMTSHANDLTNSIVDVPNDSLIPSSSNSRKSKKTRSCKKKKMLRQKKNSIRVIEVPFALD